MSQPDLVGLSGARYSGEAEAFTSIRDDEKLGSLIERIKKAGGVESARRDLLAQAVRVESSMLPSLAASLETIHTRVGLDFPLEAYVYASADINAAILQTSSRILVMVSSAAVERLDTEELEFVIGHELGHAAFGHLELPLQGMMRTGEVDPRRAMQLMAWQRKAEISADRAGMLCCGSIDIAATALFKTLSGLSTPGLDIDPRAFAAQWDDLEREVIRDGSTDHWTATHPFPPLRMKAMLHFWDSGRIQSSGADDDRASAVEAADERVAKLLAMMDPLSREKKDSADPLLVDFFLWGGLAVAHANEAVEESEIEKIADMVGRSRLEAATKPATPDGATCRGRFKEAIDQRRTPITALELHRIFSGLVAIAQADGGIDDQEITALKELGGVLGVPEAGADLLIARATS